MLIATGIVEGAAVSKFTKVSATATAGVASLSGGAEQVAENFATRKPPLEGVAQQATTNFAGAVSRGASQTEVQYSTAANYQVLLLQSAPQSEQRPQKLRKLK